MLSTLIEKELKGIISSPKFVATFAVCTLLLLLSVFIGIREYKAATKQYETATQLADQQLREATSWRMVQTKVFRQPDPMQIFISGLSYDIGRWAGIGTLQTAKLRSSAYSEDLIFAVFRFIDLGFIVTVVLSLFAILFTYDAICGERESGTLALVFSHAIPRAQFLMAKGIGAWLGLIVPVALAILLCLFLVLVSGVSFGSTEWLKTITLMGASLLYFTCFIALGLVISALTRRSSVSFLVSLVVWVAFVLIIPRAGVLAAGQVVQVPSVAEIEGQRSAFAKDRWAKHMEDLDAFWASGRQSERDTVSDDELWTHMKAQDSMRNKVEEDIVAYETRLFEDLQRRKAEQEKLAFTLSRFSPASAYQLAAMSLAGTDLSLKQRYEAATNAYRTAFNDYVEAKTAETPGGGGMTIMFSSDKGMQINSPRDQTSLDLSERPVFEAPRQAFKDVASGVVVDMGLLGLYSLLAFAGAFFAFHRYDVR